MKLKRMFLTSAAAIVLIGCASRKPAQTSETTSPIMAVSSAKSEKGGAQLWEENCNRCHNYRPAGSYSDYQWDIIMMHMRVRAQLTATEHKQILEFLQSAN